MLEVALKLGAAAGAAVGSASASLPEDGHALGGQPVAAAAGQPAAAVARRSPRIAAGGLAAHAGAPTHTCAVAIATMSTPAAAAAAAAPGVVPASGAAAATAAAAAGTDSLLPATPVAAPPPRTTAEATTPISAEPLAAGGGGGGGGRGGRRAAAGAGPAAEAAAPGAAAAATAATVSAAAGAVAVTAVAGAAAAATAGAAAAAAGAAAAAAPPGPAVLRSVSDLEAAVAHLRRVDPRLEPLIAAHGLPRPLIAARFKRRRRRRRRRGAGGRGRLLLQPQHRRPPQTMTGTRRRRRGGRAGGSCGGAAGAGGVFSALARSVAYQQLATKAASTIWGRVLGVCQVPTTAALTPGHLLAAAPEALRGAGLSGRKLEYLQGLAAAFRDRPGWEEELTAITDVDALVAQLQPLRGIGSWTVHMIAMFHLGLPDVLPTGDLGVRRGLQLMYGLRALPEVRQVEDIAAAWAPYRSVGAWYMWRIPPPPRSGGGGSSGSSKAKAGGSSSSKPAGGASKGRAAKGK
ncbi:hypothetical protein HXX76_014985 [Chlamydomonas incerta]|uniref:HhH-GPD domain-containing protein n=1 Tax=Chlamydomonas incerta TaxID=51695 RepID=A0A835SNC1_CHLIN|nr:hypothetical protein HXX76_014985 [Chlamydomonas incerta]|eukprot:KAG2423825.1 hypothetical protein HXX76_014985 [Chlamydomonas incerta]